MSNRISETTETWFQLTSWNKDQKAAERLAVQIIKSERYDLLVHPSSPLGLSDHGKDLICSKKNKKYIVTVCFTMEQKSFSEIKNYLLRGCERANINNVCGVVFITNQALSLAQRQEIEANIEYEVEIYHLNRISDILEQVINYGIRLECLDIELTKEEQALFFAHQGYDYKRKIDDVLIELDEMAEKVAYNWYLNLQYRVESLGEYVDPELWKGEQASAKRIEKKYGLENLAWDEFEWGMLNGKVSALRWVLGGEWDTFDI